MRISSYSRKSHRHSVTYSKKANTTFCWWLIWAGSLVSLARADSASVDKSCFQLDEPIRVHFNKDVDTNFVDNWVAIYRQDNLQNLQNLSPVPAMWAWTCGTQSCNTQDNMPTDGTITFENNSQGGDSQNWPLDAGLYQSVLSGGDRPYSAHAVSEPFEIGCSGTPAPEEPTVSVEKSCYQAGEIIQVSFSGAGADVEEFVALYRTSVLNDLRFLPDTPDMWIPTCGTQPPCQTVDSEGDVSFANNGFLGDNQIWPLDGGEYRAIVSGGEIPFSAVAATEAFRVGGCAQPTSRPPLTPAPIPTPTPAPVPDIKSGGMAAVIEQARADIESLIENSQSLRGKFLRLSFHDCVGGCDGEVFVLEELVVSRASFRLLPIEKLYVH
jgi:hypothetical protein